METVPSSSGSFQRSVPGRSRPSVTAGPGHRTPRRREPYCRAPGAGSFTLTVTMSVSWYCWWRTEEERWRSSRRETSRSNPDPRLVARLAENRNPILEVLPPRGDDELEHRAAFPPVRGEVQAAPAFRLLPVLALRQEGQQRLFADRVHASRHVVSPTVAGHERSQETV